MNSPGPKRAAVAAAGVIALAVGHQAGLFARIVGESSAWKSLGKSISAVDQDVPALESSLARVRSEGGDEAVLSDILCDATASAVNQDPPSIEDVISGELEKRTLRLPVHDKISEFEAGLRLSEWNSGVAARYMRACLARY